VRLARCPLRLREAFLEALYGTTAPSKSSASRSDSIKRAIELVRVLEADEGPTYTRSQNLVYLQTLILLAAEAETQARSSTHSAPSRATWLASAVGVAYHLRLQDAFDRRRANLEDPDSNDCLGRRVWFILTILDRWHAASTARPLLIPDANVVLQAEDLEVLGDLTFQLTRTYCPSTYHRLKLTG